MKFHATDLMFFCPIKLIIITVWKVTLGSVWPSPSQQTGKRRKIRGTKQETGEVK